MRPSRAVLISTSLTLALVSGAAAETAGGLKGVVLDRKGAVIAGAVITIRNAGLGLVRGAVSDPRGEFRVLPLPAGPGYGLTVQHPGMATITVSDIDVEAGRISGVPVVLSPSTQVEEHVRVTHVHDTVDLSDTTTQTRFTSEFISALPILGRDYQDILALAPGVTDLDGDGNPNIHGARDTDVLTLVDGVSTVDPLTGQVGQELNIDAIQEMEIKTSGASAEFGRAQGGFVNIITKSGGNQFTGDFKFFWRGHFLDRDGAGNIEPQLHSGLGGLTPGELNFNDYKPFLSVGGPIVKDRAWFFATGEFIQEEEPVNALRSLFIQGTREERAFTKLSWDMTPGQKLVLSLIWDPQEYTNLGLDLFTSPESGYSRTAGGLNVVFKDTAIFSPNVFLETTAQWFESRPEQNPNLDPDTNRNGILSIDRNHNGFTEGTEIDPGEDWDSDGAWDVDEDANHDFFFSAGEDRDGDGRWNLRIGCEGETREDQDCDGFLDDFNEDLNGNGVMDPGEDVDHDWVLENGQEDRNHNHRLDDRPFPDPADVIVGYLEYGTPVTFPASYPYTRLRPLPGDRNYVFEDRGRVTRTVGPFYFDYAGKRGRTTLRQDLTVFVPGWRGQHDLKFGGILERERYSQETRRRPAFFPTRRTPQLPPRVIVELSGDVTNSASSGTAGLYVQDTYKPFAGLSLGFGIRLDREATESFGYTPFDPAAGRSLYNRLRALGPRGELDDAAGNADGIRSLGYCSDPIFSMPGFSCRQNNFGIPLLTDLSTLDRIAGMRLIQHHSAVALAAENIAKLYPEAASTDPVSGELIVDLGILRQRGMADFQSPQEFRLTNNNLAPRLFVSWDPAATGRTKLFVNWSRFYDKLFLQSIVGEEGPDTVFRSYLADPDGITDSGTPDNRIGQVWSMSPPSITQVDRGLRTPFVDEWTAGFERELAPETSLKVTFVNRKYRMQLQDRDINHFMRFDAEGRPLDVIGNPPDSDGGARTADGRPDLYVQNFFFNEVFRVDNSNEAHYRGIEVQLERRLSRKWQMVASYTYSRAEGDAESFDSILGDDPSTVRDEFGYLDYDQRHVVKVNAAAFLPGDWQLGGVLSWSSGTPYSVKDMFVSFDDFDYAQFHTFYGYIKDGKYVSLRRNSERNKALFNIDVRAQKAFVLGSVNSRMFVSVQNLLNTDDLTVLAMLPGGTIERPYAQIDGVRRFGRRYEIGFHFEF